MLSVNDHLPKANESHGQVPSPVKRKTRTTVQTKTNVGENLEQREQMRSAVEIKHQPLWRQISQLETAESLHDPAVLFLGLHQKVCVSESSVLLKCLCSHVYDNTRTTVEMCNQPKCLQTHKYKSGTSPVECCSAIRGGNPAICKNTDGLREQSAK